MEHWQLEHVKQYLPRLIKTTVCNDILLATLKSQNILGDADVQYIQNKGANVEKSSLLFEILPTRKESYQALTLALHKTRQSGAEVILVAGLISHGTIHFQGKVSLISELLPNQDETLRQELISLLQKKPCLEEVVVKNLIPDKLSYYIPRTIVSRRNLEESLFREKCSEVFLFQGLEWSELSSLADELPTDVSSNLLDPSEKLLTRFVLLESMEHFDIIVAKTMEPVHVIEKTNETYHWVKSQGAVKTILKFVGQKADMMTEGNFIENILKDNIPICLTDSPGMGKSVLLGNLARAIEDGYPKRLIIFVYLREFIPVLKTKLTNKTKLDSHLIQVLLSEYVSDHPVGRRIASHKLATEHSYLCFDGFDEVLPEQRVVAKEMLKLIACSFQKCQMFVTARLHMRQELEQIIGTLGFHIAPFNLQNQIEFLTKFWKSRGAKSQALKQYANTCLTTIPAQIDESEKGIAGIPLQCYMIGEVYLDRAKCYKPGTVLGEVVPIKSIAQLYNSLINKKLDTLEMNNIKELLIQAHIHSAMALLYPEDVNNFCIYPENISKEQLCRVGIMELAASDETMRFLHRTFAEFFVGVFVGTLFQNFLGTKKMEFVSKKILATEKNTMCLIDNPVGREFVKIGPVWVFRHPGIAYFLDFQLQQRNLQTNQQNLNNKYAVYLFFYDRGVHLRSLLAAVTHGSVELFNFFYDLKWKFMRDYLTETHFPNLELVASKHSTLDTMDRILSAKNNVLHPTLSLESRTNFETSPLYVASHCGNYKMVEYLLRSNSVSLDDAPHILHFCMWYSSFQPRAVIKQKVQIIKYLKLRSKCVLNEHFIGLTPILGKYIHLDLIKCALECGSNVWDKDQNEKSVLHLAPVYMTYEIYHDLLLYLLKQFGKKILREKDIFGCTPLHYAVEYLPILSDTLTIFLNHGVDLNDKNKEGNSVLFYALRHQTEETLEIFAKNGAKLDDRNIGLETALHIAYKYMNQAAVKWLIQSGACENVQDVNGIIPSKAHFSWQENQKVIAQNMMLKSKNGNNNTEVEEDKRLGFPDAIDFTLGTYNLTPQVKQSYYESLGGNSPLHIAFCQSLVDIETIKYLHNSSDADFNARNINGETPLHLGVIIADISEEVLNFAVVVGNADLNLVNNKSYSVLAQAILAERSVAFLKLLVTYGAGVSWLNDFIVDIWSDNLKYVKFLLEHGPSSLIVSNEDEEGHNAIALAYSLCNATLSEIVKCLVTSTPHLNFKDPTCLKRVFEFAFEVYKIYVNFQTPELNNLLTTIGSNIIHFDTETKPAIFAVMSLLSQTECKCFLRQLSDICLTDLFQIQDENLHNLLFHCVNKFGMDKEILSIFSLQGVDFGLKDIQGKSVWWHAIKNSYSKNNYQELPFIGGNYSVLDDNEDNLICPSIIENSQETIECLLRSWDSLHAENQSKMTPFMQLCNFYTKGEIDIHMFRFVTRLADLNQLNDDQMCQVYFNLFKQNKLKNIERFTKVFETFKSLDLDLTSFDGILIFFVVITGLDISHVETYLKLLIHVGYTNLGEIKSNQFTNVVQYFIANKKADFPINLLPLLGDVKKILNSKNIYGFSVLNYAINFGGSLEFIKQLIENGADVNQLDNHRSSMLHHAAVRGDLNIVEFFVDQCNDINGVDNDGDSPLHYALEKYTNKHYNVVKLLTRKCESVNLVNVEQTKTIDWALRTYSKSGNFESSEIFISMLSRGLDIKSNSRLGSPILLKMITTLTGNHCEDVLKYLHDSGKTDCFHLRGHYGDTLLHRCVQNFEPSVELLNIFKLAKVDFDAKDMFGNSVLFYAVIAKRTNSFVLDLVFDGVKWNTTNTNGDNILHIAAKANNLRLMKYFTKLGADANCENVEGKLPNQIL